MRALAVLLVVLGHADIVGLDGGYVGVDVFFVISGFLITGILVREIRDTGRVSIANFYARRARRILPAATVVLLATIAVSRVAFTESRLQEVTLDVTWAAFFAANIHFAQSGSDYFADESFVSPVQHFWSLAVEEQFYLVWPLVILVILVLTDRRRPRYDIAQVHMHRRRTALKVRRLTLAIVILGGISLAWSVQQTQAAPAAAYFSSLTRTWELAIGALLALCAGSVARWHPMVKAIASWAGLAAITAAALTYSAATPFPGYSAMLPVLGAALVLAGGIDGPAHGAGLLLDTRVMRWFGDVSYSLYLWHWPFLVIPGLYLARSLTAVEKIALIAGAVAAAQVSFRLVEVPVRRSALLSRRTLGSLLLWPVAVSAVVGAVVVTGTPTTSGASVASASTGGDSPSHVDPAPGVDPPTGGSPRAGSGAATGGVPGTGGGPRTVDGPRAVAQAADLARAEAPLPERLRPALKDLFADVSRPPPGCLAERDDPKVSTCVLGDREAARTMVLFGDSHVTMWLRPLESLAKERGWRVVPFQKASCFPADVTLWRLDKNRPYTECDTWRAEAMRQIGTMKPERIVVSGLMPPNVADPSTGDLADKDLSTRLFTGGAERLLDRLRKVTPAVYVIGGTPYLEKTAEDCLGTRRATMGTCARAVEPRLTQRNREWQRASASAQVSFFNPVPWFCTATVCPVVIGDVIVYRDSNHITRTFADTLRGKFASWLKL